MKRLLIILSIVFFCLIIHSQNWFSIQKGWVDSTIESYRLRNSHIPDSYFNSTIKPFLKEELKDSFYFATYGASTKADWFWCIEMVRNGKIVGSLFEFTGGQTAMRWSINDTIYNTNYFRAGVGTTPPSPYAGMILISQKEHFAGLTRVGFENTLNGGDTTLNNKFGGYYPFHELPACISIYAGYCYFEGNFPLTYLQNCWHLCTNRTPFTGQFSLVAPKMEELYLSYGSWSGWNNDNEYPLLEYIIMNYNTSVSGIFPLIGKTMPNLYQYTMDNTSFSGSINTLDMDKITSFAINNLTGSGIGGDLSLNCPLLKSLRASACGATSVTSITLGYPLTYFRCGTNALDQSSIDRLVSCAYNGGTFATGFQYYLNGGTNATPGATAQTQIDAMRAAGITFNVNGY